MDSVTNCDNCGVCCLGQNLLPLTGNDLDGVKLPSELEVSLRTLLRGPLAGGDECPCVWLDRRYGRCKHHQYRPSFCREFEVGSEDCLRIRAEAGVDQVKSEYDPCIAALHPVVQEMQSDQPIPKCLRIDR